MSILAFDTLKFVEKLEAAGIARSHAKATAEAEGLVVAELADKDDIAAVRAELSDVKGDIAELKNASAHIEQRIVIRFEGMLVVAVGVVIAVLVL